MATTTTVSITDDLNGEDGAETVKFSFENLAFEIDLSPPNRDALLAALQPYMDHGRRQTKVNGMTVVASRRYQEPSRDYDLAELRAWAASNDIALPQRGRIPGDIVSMFKNRNNTHEPVRSKGKKPDSLGIS